MSELINNSDFRKDKLKELILKLHEGKDPSKVRQELTETLKFIPYGEVVEVEQDLIEEGLPTEDVLKLCDIHGEVLEGQIDLSGMRLIPPGHPVDLFKKENAELKKVTSEARELIDELSADEEEFKKQLLELKGHFNNLMDVDKHYQRKEFLLFPHLEKQGITGPPKVMWGKHDEIRNLLKGSIDILDTEGLTKNDLEASSEIVLMPALKGVDDMVMKEEEILFPMALDQLTDAEWYDIYNQTLDIGFCLYDPQVEWKPKGIKEDEASKPSGKDGSIQLPSGSFNAEEIMAIMNALPVDITFVDKNDKVKYFSQGKDRVFTRSRAIINRDVRYCHPPGSVHIVDKIIEDFKSGKESHAPFWIQLHGKFILIEYFALRDNDGNYLGTLEVSQDVKDHRELEGEQRILSYSEDND